VSGVSNPVRSKVEYLPSTDRTIRVRVTKPGKAPVEVIADVYSDEDLDPLDDDGLERLITAGDRKGEFSPWDGED
jgi:hypothetical protein